MNYIYYTDGAATMVKKDNKYLRKAGGWAFIKILDNNVIYEKIGGCPLTTNNEMELYAIYASIRDFLDTSNDNDTLEICSDSGYCINIFTQWAKSWQKNGWKNSKNKTVENKELIQEICKLKAKLNCELKFRKVKGHSGDEFNEKVDCLALQGKSIAKESGKITGYDKNDTILGKKESVNSY